MRVYIQKWGGEFPDDCCYTAFYGFNHKDAEGNLPKIYFFEDIVNVPIGIDEYGHPPLVVAFIEDTKRYFERCGINIPAPLNIPDELADFLHRKIERKTLGEFKKDTILPIFVKPDSEVKKFASGVIKEKSSRKELFIKNDAEEILDDNMMVLTSEVVDMISEYRCFVKEGKLVGIRHYQGDFKVFPDIRTIEEMIRAYTKAPIAYSLDVAVILTKPGSWDMDGTRYYKTILVECQDMWSIGPYGLDPMIYVSLLKKRWFEIFRNKK